jgi:flagellar motor switch protein FliM
MDYVPLGQAVEECREPALLGIGSGEPIDGAILSVIDRPMLITAMELILGGTGSNPGEGGTALTGIELRFGRRLSAMVMTELNRSLGVICPAEVELDRIETDTGSINIGKNSSLCARLELRAELAGQAAELALIMPYDGLAPIREQLGKLFYGERDQADNPWKEILDRQVRKARVNLEVVMAERAFALHKIMGWKPGDVLNVGIKEGEDATLVCADEPMFEVSLGKRNNGFIAVQVTKKHTSSKETEHVVSDH